MSTETETMSCRWAFDVDLVACLLDRDRPEWEAFRDHYPTCPACAAEVRTWTELQAELAPAHPEPHVLLRHQDAPEASSLDERAAIDAHLAECLPCRDELDMLRTTDLPALVRAGTAVSAPPPSHPDPGARRARWRRPLGARLRAIAWHPALAYGLAAVLLIPALAPYRTILSPAPPPPVARDDAPLSDAAPDAPLAARQASVAHEAESAVVDELTAASPDVWPRLDMTPTANHLVIATSPGLILTLPIPVDAVMAEPAELRLREASGGRELRERQVGAPGRRLAMRVPGTWLEPGRYVVALHLDDGRPVATATLEVAARGVR